VVTEDGTGPGPTVQVGNGGIATSTTRLRRWWCGGRERHHVLDPVTGLPTTGPWRTVTTAAQSCLDANTAATATLVHGGRGRQWLERTGLPARLVGTDGAVHRVNDWPGDECS
jgi:thiamine biosynthesis lipoprotein